MGAALRPRLEGLSRPRAYASLAIMADGNWMLAMRDFAAARNGVRSLVLGGVYMHVAWVLSTAAGLALGRLVTAPQRLGLDFTLTAFCATMVISLWRGRFDLWPIAAAAGAAVAAVLLLPAQWHILAGGLAGSLAGAWRHVPHA
jgi:predicted branched-subunit amino acid permease